MHFAKAASLKKCPFTKTLERGLSQTHQTKLPSLACTYRPNSIPSSDSLRGGTVHRLEGLPSSALRTCLKLLVCCRQFCHHLITQYRLERIFSIKCLPPPQPTLLNQRSWHELDPTRKKWPRGCSNQSVPIRLGYRWLLHATRTRRQVPRNSGSSRLLGIPPPSHGPTVLPTVERSAHHRMFLARMWSVHSLTALLAPAQ